MFRTLFRSRITLLFGSPAISLALLATLAKGPDSKKPKTTAAPTGQQVYARECASCHGAKGEGGSGYRKPLTGTRSAAELAQFIAKSMPPGPRHCPAPDSKLVAAYIYDAFYSPLAQERSRPARVALSRLTVRQYRNSVCDLVGSFRDPTKLDGRQGLRGEYFKSSHFRGEDRTADRLDPEVHFDFGAKGPTAEQADPYQFSMRWQGSVIAPDTGDYEFIVRTEHAAQLWVNDQKKPLIDALVKSGSGTEYRATITLLGGRAYPIRLEFSKGVTGVDNIEKVKQKPPAPASISLEWRRPKLPAEVIPRRCLSPVPVPTVYVPATPFPPDDRSLGYERGNSISKAWDEATTSAALDTAGYVTTHLREISGVPDDAADRKAKLEDFCVRFVERAFRRPLASDQRKFYVERRFEGAPDLETAVKRVVILALLSPRFLYYNTTPGTPDGWEVASRLALDMWDSLPDSELLKAAAANQLASRDAVEKQAERMEADPRAWYKLREFLLLWLKVDQVPDLAKDPKRFPGFDQNVAADLRSSLEIFLENTAWSDKSDFRDLMLTDRVFLNGRLAKVYGVNLPPDANFQPVELDKGERCGVLTQPYMLASFAYIDTSSPIHRGVLIARNLLGRTLLPPPAAFAPFPADLHPNMTTRQRVELQTKPAACGGCHGLINPLGFTLERFDAIGRIRDQENGKPVDCTASFRSRAGSIVRLDGARDLATYLATSNESRSAFVEKLFQNLTKQPIRAYGPKMLPDLERSFESNQCSIRKLMSESAAIAALQP